MAKGGHVTALFAAFLLGAFARRVRDEQVQLLPRAPRGRAELPVSAAVGTGTCGRSLGRCQFAAHVRQLTLLQLLPFFPF